MLSRPHHPLCQHPANLPQVRILRDLYLGIAEVLVTSEPESEPEQSIENTWLAKAKKANLSKSLKTKGRAWARFFVKS
jgi:hypothetical protein